MTDDLRCPTFTEAVAQFRTFLRGQGWPDQIKWIDASDVVRQAGRPPVVDDHANGDGDRKAEVRYDLGRNKRLGVLLEGVCTLSGRSCAIICSPSDAVEAEYLMYPSDGGIKLSVAVPRTEGIPR
jgi:hypothetical protein